MPPPAESRAGAAFAAGAFLLWGLSPVYFKAVAGVPALEIMAHRILWSLLLLAVLLTLWRGWRPIARVLTNRPALRSIAVSTVLVSINWFVFIWAIEAGRLLEISLGYYINPLVSVLLGFGFLRERLGPWQWAAVGLAGAGVANLAVQSAGFPWVSLALAFSFAFYGLARKTAPLASMQGLFLETLLLAPLALGYLLVLGAAGAGHFAALSPGFDLLLALSGAVTAVPLLFFTSAARRLKLSTVGFFQYIAPSCQFLLAILLFGETLTPAHLIAFLAIWAALALYTLAGLRTRRRTPVAAP